MNDLELIRDFYEISQSFSEGNYDLLTISGIISKIRSYAAILSPEEARILLDIPISILENDVELINPNKWAEKNSGYFAGNITWVDSNYFNQLKTKFAYGSFDLNDIVDLVKKVRDDYLNLYLASEFLLRNVEVTFRDDVKLVDVARFHKNGNLFAEQIKKAIKCKDKSARLYTNEGGNTMYDLSVIFFLENSDCLVHPEKFPNSRLVLNKTEDAAYINLLLHIDKVSINNNSYEIIDREFSVDSTSLFLVVKEI